MFNISKEESYKTLYNDIKGLKVGVMTEFFDDCDDEIKNKVISSVNNFKSLGAQIKEFNTNISKNVISTYYIISLCEASSNLSRYDSLRYGIDIDNYDDFSDLVKKSRTEGFGTEVKKRIMVGNFSLSTLYKENYYLKALQMRESIKNKISQILDDVDILILPTSKICCQKKGEFIKDKILSYSNDSCSSLANVASLCAINLPCSKDKNGVPFGFTLMAKNGNDNFLLNVSNIYEKTFLPSIEKPLIYGGEV
jgi:aspartyl-tRNA(Asn)/glutamyl-tRNA(Gln) amidotransferase subunit A